MAKMAVGVIAGIGAGAWGTLQGMADLAVNLVTNPIGVVTGIYNGFLGLMTNIATGNVRGVVASVFPDLVELCANWNNLSSYDRGFLVGKVIGQVVTQIALIAATGGVAWAFASVGVGLAEFMGIANLMGSAVSAVAATTVRIVAQISPQVLSAAGQAVRTLGTVNAVVTAPARWCSQRKRHSSTLE